MLSLVREDNLGFHIRQLKWIGYPLMFLLVANLTCVLYAVSRPTSNAELSAQVVDDIETEIALPIGGGEDGGLTLMSPEQSAQLERELRHERELQTEDLIDDVDKDLAVNEEDVEVAADIDTTPAGVVEAAQREIETVGRDLVTSSHAISQPGQLLTKWGRRIASWRASAQDNTTALIAEKGDTLAEDPASSGEMNGNEATETDGAEPPLSELSASDESLSPTSGLLIRNPGANRGSVTFVVNDQQVSLKPGTEEHFSAESSYRILFHRGGSFGNASHTLREGSYQFGVGKTGWELTENDN